MKSIFYLLTILFLSLLIACSEEPPTYIDVDSLSKKPKPPEPTQPLPALNQNTKYIVGYNDEERHSDPKVFIWDGSNLSENWWSRSIEAFTIGGVGIGNFIGESGSSKELIVERRIKTGRGNNKKEYQELLIFMEGETEPTVIFRLRQHFDFRDAVWDMKIGNVDNDAELEIVILFRDQIEIWEYDDNSGFSFKASNDYYSSSSIPWRADISNFDGDNVNEIIVAFGGGPLWRVYKDNGSQTMTEVQEAPVSGEINSLSSAKMINIDNVGGIEVIGCSSSPNKLLLWEDPNTNPTAFIASQEFIYSPWGVGVGDLDGDPLDGKIIAGVYRGGLHLLHYAGGGLIYDEEVVPGLPVSLDGVIVADINNNNALEIIVATENGLQVFDNTFFNPFVDNVGRTKGIVCQ